ncbi:MAG: M20 family metallopeptidase [Fusobacterium sp. JB021]|nr:M20 family metallopeptidase [Fusobacterium sp. JB021]MDP0506472.1 M20 family metallopeptidase [Fusobacterium sp. JB019]MDP0506571.1 M20 family metallopeptidase [Fusobacterium sp. JB019]
MKKKILNSANKIGNFVIDVRRELHKYPELGFSLPKTTEIICKILDNLKIDYQKNIGESGIVANIEGKDKNITLAFRADMDALPIIEETEFEFKSEHYGKMHACGHDAHMSILLGVAKVISENKEELPCNVRLIFQPAEETTGGAVPMIEEGVLKNVNGIFGLHVDPSINAGKIAIKYGAMNAASTGIKIKIKGKSCHGAYPSTGIDAIVIAAQVITALQTIVSRNIDSRESLVLSFGKIIGGETENVITGDVLLEGTIRTLSNSLRDSIKPKIKNMVEMICEGMGAIGEVEYRDSYMALINKDEFVDLIKLSGNEILGFENVKEKKVPEMVVEDFAYYLDKVPGAFFNLGVGKKGEENKPLHNGLFSIEESSLSLGVKVQIMNLLKAYDYLKNI